MKLKIFYNELDATEFKEYQYQCLLTEWMSIREEYPNARLYKDIICIQNDVTPKTKQEALLLLNAHADYQILCHAGEPITIFYAVVAVISIGMAVYTYMNMPDLASSDTSGSSNNSLANRQNKHRVSERVSDIYGTAPCIPDLIAPTYRYYADNVQVEECLLCIGTGYFEINQDEIKEGETPINTIEGASLSVYEPNVSLINTAQIKIGEAFTELPLVTKQVNSIDGKQKLISPNQSILTYSSVGFLGNKINVSGGVQYTESDTIYTGGIGPGGWAVVERPVYADFSQKFVNGEQIIIENAIYGSAPDSSISGTTDVDRTGILTIASTVDIKDPEKYRKIRISGLIIQDAVEGELNLAGEFSVSNIVKTGSNRAWFYEVTLAANYIEGNINFGRMSADNRGVLSGVLTDHDENIDLSGTYTIASMTSNQITLVNPSSVNSDWLLLANLTEQQVQDMLRRSITFKGTNENFIGWYYAGNQETEGMILNFLAPSGIYESDRAKQVAIELQYQRVINGIGVGIIYSAGIVMQGRANNRDQIGATIRSQLPFSGQFRFRVKRINDNGNSTNLIDDVIFESAYSFYKSKKSVYEYDTIIRLKRLAIGSGTNASELNMIATRKLYSYASDSQSAERIATNNFADIFCNIATDQSIGRMHISELDVPSLYILLNEINDYFGTDKASEFNYTFDDKNSSYQEMIIAIAEAVFCTARRENGKHFFTFEKETVNSLLLFNHRNIKPETMTVSESFGIQDGYDGVELKWRDPEDNYAEAIIQLPDALQSNYKTIETVGITNKLQAHFLANRAWNKIRFNRKNIEFTGYGETDLVTRKDRIAVVDSTVPIFCSGQIEAQNNTILTLDYPVDLLTDESYVIHLQIKSGVVDVIQIVRQLNEYQIEIARIPLMPLVVDGVVNAVFSITTTLNAGYDAYLIEEKSAGSIFESTIKAMRYDSRYYPNDKDHINGLI